MVEQREKDRRRIIVREKKDNKLLRPTSDDFLDEDSDYKTSNVFCKQCQQLGTKSSNHCAHEEYSFQHHKAVKKIKGKTETMKSCLRF